MKKQILILGVIFSFVLIAYAYAEGTESLTCGEDCSWSYDSESKTLTISGSGAMKDFGPDGAVGNLKKEYWKERPWNDVATEVEHVVVSGLSSIGHRAFQGMTNLIDAQIDDSVTSIGRSSFQQNSSLQTLIIPKSVTQMYVDVFGSVPQTASIYCSEEMKSSCVNAFSSKLTEEQINNMLKIYTTNGERYVFDGKEYKSLKDYRNNHEYLPKRIYTVNEANEASGKKNSVMIRYK